MPGDVEVFYHDTTNGDPFVPLTVTGIVPSTGSSHASSRSFDPTAAGANPATYNYTGTYSYLIAPDFGGVAISSPIESYFGLDAPDIRPGRPECRRHVRRECADDPVLQA